MDDLGQFCPLSRSRPVAMVALAVLAAAVLALGTAGAAGAGAATSSAAGTGRRAGEAALARLELAWVHRGALSVADGLGARPIVVARGPYRRDVGSAIQDPGFSHDGRLLAYVEVGGSSSALEIVPIHGGRAITIRGARSYAWSPVADELAVSLPDAVELVGAGGTRLRRWKMTDPGTELFSPSGGSIAVGSSPARSPRGYLHLLPVGAAAPHAIRQPGCDLPAGWTADGSHLLFWRDGYCSASIAADGLPLDSVAVRALAGAVDGRVSGIVHLGMTLPYPSWIVPVAGRTVLVNSGGDRVAADHKRLRSCDAATGACRPLPLPAGVTSLDPAFARRARRLFAVRVTQSNAMNDFLPGGTLWVCAPDGAHARELTAAGHGVGDPVPTADGAQVIFVRMVSDRSASLQALTVRTGAVRTIAAIDLDDYYGEFMSSAVLAVWQPGS